MFVPTWIEDNTDISSNSLSSFQAFKSRKKKWNTKMSETQPFKSHGLFLLWHSLMAVIHISLVSGEGACNMNISAPPIFLIHTAHLHGSLSTVSVWPRPFVYTTETWYFRAVSLKQMGSALAAWCVLPFTDWLKTTSRHILSHSDAKAYLWLTG